MPVCTHTETHTCIHHQFKSLGAIPITQGIAFTYLVAEVKMTEDGCDQVRSLQKDGASRLGCLARLNLFFLTHWTRGAYNSSLTLLLPISKHKRPWEYLKGYGFWILLEELGVEMLPPLLTLSLIREAVGLQMTDGRGIPKCILFQHFTTEVGFQAQGKG